MIGSFKRIAFAVVMVAASAAMAQVQVDKDLPQYKAVEGISGTVKSVGSDTLNELMTGWAEDFHKFYPGVKIEIEGKGSNTAPPALIEGTSQFGPMSREMKGSEVDDFKKKYGYPPTQIKVAVDSLGVFVNKDCPIKSLTIEQLRQIFSVEGKHDMTWGEIGVTDPAFKDKVISLYGRNSASGTYGYFKDHALGKKDYKPTVKEQPGSSSVVQAVASDKLAMGYSGIGYATADVKAVPLAAEKGGQAFEANAENAYSGDYPLSRFLFVYINVKPGQEPAPIVREFMRLVLSQQGQETTVKYGYYPLPNRVAQEGSKALSGAAAGAKAQAK
jgi:phosphate transport system substrate-binding protein